MIQGLPELPQYSADSLAAMLVEPGELKACSLESGWNAALLRIYRSDGESDAFDTPSTADVKIVVNLEGQSELRCLRRGLWHTGVKAPGTVGMTPAGQSSRLRWRSLTADGFVQAHLFMPTRYMEEAIDERRPTGRPADRSSFNVLAADDATVAALVGDLVRGMRAGEGDLFAEERLRLLADRLTRTADEWRIDRERDPGVLGDARLRRGLEFMSADLSADYSLGRIAREAGLSPYHFVRLFRKATGVPPHAFLTGLRLDAARRLLERSDLSITEIAHLAGYSLPRNFGTAFAKRFGSTPGVWRRENGTALARGTP